MVFPKRVISSLSGFNVLVMQKTGNVNVLTTVVTLTHLSVAEKRKRLGEVMMMMMLLLLLLLLMMMMATCLSLRVTVTNL